MADNYDLSGSIGYLSAAANRAISNALTRAFQNAGHNITFEQWAVLAGLWNKDGQCQHEIASCQGKDRPTITRLLDNLEKKNLVVRIPSETDKRIKKVFLTYQTRQFMPGLIVIYEHTMQYAKHEIGEAELEICRHVLAALVQNLLKME